MRNDASMTACVYSHPLWVLIIVLVWHRWTESWRRLKAVREAAALDITNADVLAAVCGALLRCQVWHLAGKYLGGTASTPLPASTAEALVLGRSRELLRSAASFASQEVAQVWGCHLA